MRRSLRHGATAFAAALLAMTTACGTETAPRASGAGEGAGPAAARPERPFTLLATGDILTHASIIRQARADARGQGHDFRRMLSGAKPLTDRADLALCHMETVYGPDGGPFSGYPMFVTPPQVARAIKDTGYQGCSTASNHTLDSGAAGVERTLRAMDRAGLAHVGSARTAAERAKPALFKAGGATVAQLAYTYGTNGIPVPEGRPWLVNLIDRDRVVADARAARRAGADIVVVSLHWGTEWQEAPDRAQLRLADTLTRSRHRGRRDVDLILGTHNHVPQPYEKVNGTWVVYGMGDQLAGIMNDPRGLMSSAARFTFVPPREKGGSWRVRKAEYLPFLVDSADGYRSVNLNALTGNASSRPAYATALRTVKKAVLSRGAAKHGLVMGR